MATAVFSSLEALLHGGSAAIRDLSRLFMPETCVGCGQPLQGDERDLCLNCMVHLPLADYSAAESNATELRLMGRIYFVAATSLLLFRKGGITQSIVHSIKYYGNEPLGLRMGNLMGKDLMEAGRFDDIDVIVPVPLHRRKQRLRGYNQSLLLCRGIAEVMGKPVVEDAVARKVHTDSQTHKDREERVENISNAFVVANPQPVEGRHVLLVDDVITTGATIAECADVLLQLAGTRVSVASLAIAGA